MRYTTLLAAALVCASISAQNDFLNYPLATNFTSRGSNATSPGEILMGYHKESFRGIGQWNPVKTELVTQFTATIQDQVGKTQETYNWVVRKGTDAKGPMLGKAGELYVSAAQKTPTSSATGPVAWTVTHTLTSPVAIPDDFFAVGFRLTAAKLWTADGMSCWMAVGTKTSTNAAGAMAGTQQVDQAWDLLATSKVATHPSMKRCWKITIQVKNPAFQVGNRFNSGNNYGPGGLYPDMLAKPAQGLAMRVNAKGADGQVALVFMSGDLVPFKLPIFFGTRFYLHPTSLVGAPLNLGVIASGKAEKVTIPVIPSFMAKKAVAFQAVLVDVKKLSLTLSNAVKTQF